MSESHSMRKICLRCHTGGRSGGDKPQRRFNQRFIYLDNREPAIGNNVNLKA